MGLVIDATLLTRAEREGLTPAQLTGGIIARHGHVGLATSAMTAGKRNGGSESRARRCTRTPSGGGCGMPSQDMSDPGVTIALIPMTALGARPIVNAMLVCDHAHRDPSTGKHSLLGIFDRVNPQSFPATTPPFGVYLNLTNLNGTYRIGLKWVDGRTEDVLGTMDGEADMRVTDPLARVELSFSLPDGLPLPAPGRYILRLEINGQHLQDLAIIAGEPTA